MKIEQRCRQEIEQLHGFFERWFNGRVEQTQSEFSRLDIALDADFVLVGPDGVDVTRKQLIDDIWDHWNHPADEGKDFHIEVSDVSVRRRLPLIFIATYTERQEVGDEVTERRSTVVFRETPEAPNDLEWLHLHESWIG